jgi:Ca2+-binding EF-hand superfamily protein
VSELKEWLDHEHSESEVNEFIKQMDQDKNGSIDFEEFAIFYIENILDQKS